MVLWCFASERLDKLFDRVLKRLRRIDFERNFPTQIGQQWPILRDRDFRSERTRQIGGTIEFKSEPGHGMTVILTVPLVGPVAAAGSGRRRSLGGL